MKRIFIEKDKCEGCLNCNIACINAHRDTDGTVYDVNLTASDSETRNFIYNNEGNGKYIPIFCRHCDIPECVATCMSGALYQDEETGHVLYNKELCGACFMCVMSCNFSVPKPNRLDASYVIKCDFCKNKETGPSCVAACSTEAIYVKEV